ncbi:hypothetical protein HDU99_001983 [Rhizoclosmatium hyalinum]|nr:hypothetical protein HDU99_001983 [Rhizoclosmatium hyalinum]
MTVLSLPTSLLFHGSPNHDIQVIGVSAEKESTLFVIQFLELGSSPVHIRSFRIQSNDCSACTITVEPYGNAAGFLIRNQKREVLSEHSINVMQSNRHPDSKSSLAGKKLVWEEVDADNVPVKAKNLKNAIMRPDYKMNARMALKYGGNIVGGATVDRAIYQESETDMPFAQISFHPQLPGFSDMQLMVSRHSDHIEHNINLMVIIGSLVAFWETDVLNAEGPYLQRDQKEGQKVAVEIAAGACALM